MSRVDPASCRVGIGLPVYNGERFLEAALKSILAQRHENFELIICDNASTDRTADICRDYAARDRRIRYSRNLQNIGLQANFRRALDLSLHGYFMWTAADDIRPPNALESLLDALVHNEEAVMAYGPLLLAVEGREGLIEVTNEMHMDGLGAASRVRTFTESIRHNVMFYGLYRPGAAARAVLGRHFGLDYLYCLQISLLGPLVYVNTPMLVYRHWANYDVDNPMYEDRPATIESIARARGIRRNKCWTVLLRGCYYIATIPGPRLRERAGGIAAHVLAFTRRFHHQLLKEAAAQPFRAIAWIVNLPRRLRRRATAVLWPGRAP